MSTDRLLRLPSYLMLQLTKVSRRISNDDLRGPHVWVLACLADIGPASQKEISERLRLDASDLVSLLDDLEEHGYADRRRDELDRRRYSVALTATGRRALKRRLEMAQKHEDLLFAPLSEQEREQLTALLLKTYLHHATQH